jgi:2-dehydropantoate 2-reductase
LGCLYAHLFHQAEIDVTLLARGERYDWITENGLMLVNEITGEQGESRVNVVKELKPDDSYDLVIVLIRKNKLPPVFEILAASPGVKSILFMGNNALGFDEYLKQLPAEKLLFGFPGAGGGMCDQVVHYADREKPKGKRRAVTIGEIDGLSSERTAAVASLFTSAGVPVHVTANIDGWLRYHAALVNPFVGALYKHNCDNYRAARDRETLRAIIRAAKEGGRVLRALGFVKEQPFQLTLFYWLPEFLSMTGVKQLLESKFAEVAFAMHARAARDEMGDLANEFRSLIEKTSLETPNIDRLRDSGID